jgi:hypothetical protein
MSKRDKNQFEIQRKKYDEMGAEQLQKELEAVMRRPKKQLVLFTEVGLAVILLPVGFYFLLRGVGYNFYDFLSAFLIGCLLLTAMVYQIRKSNRKALEFFKAKLEEKRRNP